MSFWVEFEFECFFSGLSFQVQFEMWVGGLRIVSLDCTLNLWVEFEWCVCGFSFCVEFVSWDCRLTLRVLKFSFRVAFEEFECCFFWVGFLSSVWKLSFFVELVGLVCELSSTVQFVRWSWVVSAFFQKTYPLVFSPKLGFNTTFTLTDNPIRKKFVLSRSPFPKMDFSSFYLSVRPWWSWHKVNSSSVDFHFLLLLTGCLLLDCITGKGCWTDNMVISSARRNRYRLWRLRLENLQPRRKVIFLTSKC